MTLQVPDLKINFWKMHSV